ncbi:MAG: M56 family metallopeptidase [Bacteroidota bacterium]
METQELIKAIYLTLLHSMWQGAAIAGVAGLIIVGMKNCSSSVRYNVLAGSMVFFIMCTAVTFFSVINAAIPQSVIGEPVAMTYTNSLQLSIPSNLLDQAFLILSSYSNNIVLVWFIIICFKGIEMSIGLQRVSRLKTKQIAEPGIHWIGLVSELSKRLGIKTAVRFAESGLTSIPLTVGYFKPVILVPVGMLAAIPAEQVEAILLHELAHIKRQDYFINIFQSLVDVLFFFNPAIWWLSSHLRAERENCCDDLAIANSSGKTDYVRALISFEEYRTQHPQLSISFAGTENTLLKRTKRIIYNQNDTLNPMEKFILTSGLVVSGLLSFAFTDGAKEQISKTFTPVVSKISASLPKAEKALALLRDTIPASSIREVSINSPGSATFKAVHRGKTYKIVMQDDQVTDLYINNMKIPQEKLAGYTNDIIEIVQFNDSIKLSGSGETRSSQEGVFTAFERFDKPTVAVSFGGKKSNITSTISFDKDAAPDKFTAFSTPSESVAFSAVTDTIVPTTPPAHAAPRAPRALPALPAIPARPPKPPLAPESEGKALKAISAKPAKMPRLKPMKAINIKVAPAIEVHPTPAPKPVIHISPKVSPAEEIRELPAPEKPQPAGKGESAMSYSTRLSGSAKVLYAANLHLSKKNSAKNFSDQVNKQLIAEGLVRNQANFSYKLNNNELIIDGVKQSDELHKRIVSQVLKNKSENIEFTYRKN